MQLWLVKELAKLLLLPFSPSLVLLPLLCSPSLAPFLLWQPLVWAPSWWLPLPQAQLSSLAQVEAQVQALE